MASLECKNGGWWRLNWGSKENKRGLSLGRIPEERALKIKADFEAGCTPEPLKLTQTELRRAYFKSKERSDERGIEWHLTLDEFYAMYERCGAKCQVTGIPFSKYRHPVGRRRPWYVSIDRIDSRKDYTVENCRLVCIAANVAMAEWGDAVLKMMAQAMILGKLPSAFEQMDCITDEDLSAMENPDFAFYKLARKAKMKTHQEEMKALREKRLARKLAKAAPKDLSMTLNTYYKDDPAAIAEKLG